MNMLFGFWFVDEVTNKNNLYEIKGTTNSQIRKKH